MRLRVLLTSGWVVTAVLWMQVLSVRAQAPGGIERVIAEAESLYVLGAFEDPTPLLSYPMDEATDEQATAAYRLLALLYIGQGAEPQAKVIIVRLLNRVPGYQPDPIVDPPAYVALVNEIQQIFLSPPSEAPSCDEEMAVANARYVEGAFGEAVAVLSECLNQRFMFLTADEQVDLLRLLALVHLRTGDMLGVRNTVEKILALDPAYTPDPVRDPPGYVEIFKLITTFPRR